MKFSALVILSMDQRTIIPQFAGTGKIKTISAATSVLPMSVLGDSRGMLAGWPRIGISATPNRARRPGEGREEGHIQHPADLMNKTHTTVNTIPLVPMNTPDDPPRELVNHPTNEHVVLEPGLLRVNGNLVSIDGREEAFLLVLAQYARSRTPNADPLYFSTRKLLELAKRKFDADTIYRIVNSIRAKLERAGLNRRLLDSKPRAGYWLGTPPDQITLLVEQSNWFNNIPGYDDAG